MKDAPHSVLYLWPGALMFASRSVRNQPHAHVAASLLVALDQPFELSVAGDAPVQAQLALVAPNAEQHLDSRGAAVLVVHLDPDLPQFQRIAGHLAGERCAVLTPERVAGVRAQLRELVDRPCGAEQASALLAQLIALLASGAPPAAPLDPRIAQLAQRLRAELPERLDLAQLAREAGLSESRLMHLFSAQIGVTLRRFMLNLRLHQAMRLWRPGMSLSALAAEAGFYDQPHLVRTARSLVDVLPSGLTDGRAVQVVRCG